MTQALRRYKAEVEGLDGGEREKLDWIALFIGGEVERPPRDEIFTGATDGHGHTAQVRASMPPHLVAEIDRIVALQIEPRYKTRADFLRDAATHRLWDLVLGETGPSERAKDMHKRRMVADAMREYQEWVESGETLVREVEDTLRNMAGKPRFEQLLETMEGYALGMQPPWRQGVLDLIQRYRGE
jgi:hypothetical protein